MMYNFRNKGGFSLIELLIGVTIMLIIVGIAAFFLEDYLYKSKVAKAQQDLDIFASAVNLRNAVEPAVFSAYNYNTQAVGNTLYFSWYQPAVAGWNALWNTVGGAASIWGDYSGNSLNSLIGAYLTTVPKDPWGMPYQLNTSAGYIASMASDLITCKGGNSFGITESGREKDIVRYYLGDKLILSSVAITDVDNSNSVTGGDYCDFTFNKDVQWTGAAVGIVPATDFVLDNAETGTFVTAPAANDFGTAASLVRLQDNGRVVRLIFPPTVTSTNVLGKWIKVKMTSYFNGVLTCNPKILDMDQYAKSGLGSYFFGHPLTSDNNPARQLSFKLY